MKTVADPLAYLADELDELRRQNLYRPLRVMTCGMPGGRQSMTGSSRIASYFNQAARAVGVRGGSLAQSGVFEAVGSQTRKMPSPRSAAARFGSIVACRWLR